MVMLAILACGVSTGQPLDVAVPVDALNINRRGRYRIQRDLRTRGVSAEIIEQTLEAVEDEDALEAARTLALRRWKRLRSAPDPRKQYQKIYNLRV